ncbi:interleukin-1 receptor accessory protein-like isoform X3 [Hippocampus comes]|uniref:interleukin-1 receptor accessory protein-like isoform X3 n=1 Tax=Hippocampus comes TaxID=109280 RepID=UPI00094E5C2D|nr:PREDICTED: interleukin-1 receptor accessory protein-like isoform X3 [Hippocampus comes]
MTLSSVIKALGSLSLLVADAAPAVSEYSAPVIIGPDCMQIKAQPGHPLVLHCQALTNYGQDVTLLYWLINGSFPEDVPSNDRITELETFTLEDGAIQLGSLLLKNVTLEDLNATFTCVVINSAGMVHKNVTLTAKGYAWGKKMESNIRRNTETT